MPAREKFARMVRARSMLLLGSSSGLVCLVVLLLVTAERNPPAPARADGEPPALPSQQVFEAATETPMLEPEGSEAAVDQALAPAVGSTANVTLASSSTSSEFEAEVQTFSGCDCYEHQLRVRFVGVDARVMSAGRIGIGLPTPQNGGVWSLGANYLTGPQDPVYEVGLTQGQARVEIHARDSRAPIWTTVVTREPPCSSGEMLWQTSDRAPDLVVDLAPLLHIREVRFLDDAGRRITPRLAVFQNEIHSFDKDDDCVLLVHAATGTQVRGWLEVAGYRDRELRFVLDAGRFSEAVELELGYEVELRAKDLRYLGAERMAGLFVQEANRTGWEPNALMTIGSDVRGENQGYFFCFDATGSVRLRLPRAGDYAARPIVGQAAGPGIRVLAAAEDGLVFTVEPQDSGIQTVVLDARAWNELGE